MIHFRNWRRQRQAAVKNALLHTQCCGALSFCTESVFVRVNHSILVAVMQEKRPFFRGQLLVEGEFNLPLRKKFSELTNN